ncbi:MAG: 4Fe-4S binding protein [Candidatus Asgardarchaeia archaeon]
MIGVLISIKEAFLQLFRKPFTVPYPDKEKPRAERFRGVHALNVDTCKGCALCAMNCPNFAIQMVKRPNRKFKNPQIDLTRCMFCGLCVMACPFGSLIMTNIYDVVATSPEELILTPEDMFDRYLKFKKSQENEAKDANAKNE